MANLNAEPDSITLQRSNEAHLLEIGKFYLVVPNDQAKRHGYLRIIDESGDDYGYSANGRRPDNPRRRTTHLSGRASRAASGLRPRLIPTSES
jgi:hypothetical protein